MMRLVATHDLIRLFDRMAHEDVEVELETEGSARRRRFAGRRKRHALAFRSPKQSDLVVVLEGVYLPTKGRLACVERFRCGSKPFVFGYSE